MNYIIADRTVIPAEHAQFYADYQSLALEIAREPALCAELKSKLARNRRICPLFDTEEFTRNIEAAYTIMWERYQRGEAPQSFAVKPTERRV